MQQTLQIYINDQMVDLGTDEPPAYTLQVNNLNDLASQQSNFTKQIALPLTQRNRIIFGFPDDITFNTGLVYTEYSAKFIQSGVEIIPNGLAIVKNVQNGLININIFSGNFDFFNSLQFQIYDMGDSTSQATQYGQELVWAPYDHVWNVDNAAHSQQKTDGWIWPIIDYGAINITDFTTPINVRQQRPAFFVHTAVELLVQSTGYRIDYDRSSLMKDELYKRLLIPFSNDSFEHGTNYQNTPDNLSMIGNKLSAASIHLPGSPASGEIHFDQMEYTATQNVKGTVTLQFDLFMQGHPGTGHPSEITIGINVRNPDTSNVNVGSAVFSLDNKAEYVSGSGSGLIQKETFLLNKVSADVDLTPGMVININYSVKASGVTYWIMKAGALFEFRSSEQQVLYNQPIQCERILPALSQLDFLKDIFQHFGIICQADSINQKVIFAKFDDIVANIPNAVDWSDKVKDQGKQVEFQLSGDYAQVNWMRYTFDDNDVLKLLLPQYFADDKIIINDKTITPNNTNQDLFTSNFSPSINRPYYGGTIAQILKIDLTNSPTEFSTSTVPRLLVDQKYTLKQQADGSGEKVRFTDVDGGGGSNDVVVNDVISIPYFFKPDAPVLENGAARHLCYCDKGGIPGLRTTYYKGLERVLAQTKKVTRYIYLTPQDVKDFDFLTPVYLRLDSAYFYVARIDSWQKGQVCKAELVRL